MKLLNKQENHHKLFTKMNQSNSMFNKINLRKADNSIARVGHFIKPFASSLGLGGVVQQAVNTSHRIKNGLEKSINLPMKQIRNHSSYS